MTRGELTVVPAGRLRGLSVRQGRRAWKRFAAADVAGRTVRLHQARHADFGPTLACEKIAADHGIAMRPDTPTAPLKSRGL